MNALHHLFTGMACRLCGAPYTGEFGLGPCVKGHTMYEEFGLVSPKAPATKASAPVVRAVSATIIPFPSHRVTPRLRRITACRVIAFKLRAA
jgi:hypothetical protein